MHGYKKRQETSPCPTKCQLVFRLFIKERHSRFVPYKNSISQLFPYTYKLKFMTQQQKNRGRWLLLSRFCMSDQITVVCCLPSDRGTVYSPYPLGLFFCQRHVSRHMSSIVLVASQPSSFLALSAFAYTSSGSPGRRPTIS